MIVDNVTSTDHLGMLRIDCSGKKRLTLHVPSSHELESVNIIMINILARPLFAGLMNTLVLCLCIPMLHRVDTASTCLQMQCLLQEGMQKLDQHPDHQEDVPDRQQVADLSNTAQKLLQLKEAGNKYDITGPVMPAVCLSSM